MLIPFHHCQVPGLSVPNIKHEFPTVPSLSPLRMDSLKYISYSVAFKKGREDEFIIFSSTLCPLTMARLLASIFVNATHSSFASVCSSRMRRASTREEGVERRAAQWAACNHYFTMRFPVSQISHKPVQSDSTNRQSPSISKNK